MAGNEKKNYLISNILRCFNITRVAIKNYVTEKYGNKRQREPRNRGAVLSIYFLESVKNSSAFHLATNLHEKIKCDGDDNRGRMTKDSEFSPFLFSNEKFREGKL